MRDIGNDFQTEIDSDSLRPNLLVKSEFDSGDVLAWSGAREIEFNGDTYLGVGNFMGVSPVQETQNLQANNVDFSLSGIPSSYTSLALNPSDYHWRPITLYFSVHNEDGTFADTPYILFKGKMDIMEIDDNGDTSTITTRAENHLIALKENVERRYTPEDQKREYAGDKGLDFVPTIQDITVTWGAT